MQNTDILIIITAIVTLVLSTYYSFSANKKGNLYIKNLRELIRVKEELVETKTELIRKTEMCQGFIIENKYLAATCAKLNKTHSETALALFEEQIKKVNVMGAIAAIGRRISIKDLEAFKQRCAEIYNETTPE